MERSRLSLDICIRYLLLTFSELYCSFFCDKFQKKKCFYEQKQTIIIFYYEVHICVFWIVSLCLIAGLLNYYEQIRWLTRQIFADVRITIVPGFFAAGVEKKTWRSWRWILGSDWLQCLQSGKELIARTFMLLHYTFYIFGAWARVTILRRSRFGPKAASWVTLPFSDSNNYPSIEIRYPFIATQNIVCKGPHVF